MQRVGRVARWGGNGELVIVRPIGNESTITDTQWGDAYPYVDKKKDEESEFEEIKMGEYAGIAWKYLKHKASKTLFTDWSAVSEFCNKMNYHTDDIDARGALGQLFDTTLYADDRPWNLSARGELYCTLGVISENILQSIEALPEKEKTTPKKGKKKKEKTEKQIPYAELRKYFINLAFKYLVSKDTKNLRTYDFSEGKVGDKLDKSRPKPFQTYLIDPTDYYDSVIGLILTKREKSTETRIETINSEIIQKMWLIQEAHPLKQGLKPRLVFSIFVGMNRKGKRKPVRIFHTLTSLFPEKRLCVFLKKRHPYTEYIIIATKR
ncbi:CriSPR-associated helicase Cas3 [groundwater metagenome]